MSRASSTYMTIVPKRHKGQTDAVFELWKIS